MPLVATLADLSGGELGLVQVLFQAARAPWAESILRSVTNSRGEPLFIDAPEITSLAREKVSSPLFAVVLRIAARAREEFRALQIAERIAAGLSLFGSPRTNQLMALEPQAGSAWEADILGRTSHRPGMLLSAEELASLIRFPGKEVEIPELVRRAEKSKRAPAEVLGEGTLLGFNEDRGRIAEVRLPAEARTKHLHVVGSSGTGKSTLLIRTILEDIEAGRGVGVLDPHGDLVDEIAARVPEGRLSEVVLFDPSDSEHPIGWNFLGAVSEAEKELLASDLVGVFRRLSTSWGDQMTSVLANAILVFLESERGGTLLDLRQFLVDESFRKRMLATVQDPHLRSYWQTEFPLIAGRKPQAPILTRLDTFLRSKTIRRIVTVRKPKLDFRKLVDGGGVFLGKLALGEIGEANAALLGSLLVSKIHQVTLARQGQDPSLRRPFFLYIDEFHQVATPSMASLFSGARKYRLGLAVAHQDLYQLRSTVPEVERSLLANAYTRICFRLGDEDARTLSRGFAYFGAEDLTRLSVGEAICRVGSSEEDFNLRTLPLEELGRQEAERRREELREISGHRWGVPPEEPSEEEPLPAPVEALREAEAPSIEPEKAEPPRPAREEKPPAPTLKKDELDYLELVAREPFLGVRERNARLGLSAWKGQRLKKALIEEGLVREVAVHPGGRGQRFLLLETTQTGREILASYGIRVGAGRGRGGLAHQWWVRRIADWLEERGVSAVVEDDTRGARVDLSFSSESGPVAVEVEMGEGHAVENVRKDLEAGYSEVVVLFDDPQIMERIRERLSTEYGEKSLGVHLSDLRDFEAALAPLAGASAPLRGPKQEEEPRGRRRRPARKTPPPEPPAEEPSPLVGEPGALPTPAAAEYLGLSPATLETMRTRGGGPVFVKLGRRVVYRREDLDEWLEERRRTSTADPGDGPA
ncbi:MAG: helix-turn-helix domain-containing protein [Thermoanaerobaculia bacterium]